MNILYDGEIYKLQPTGGINRYFANLIDHLPTDVSPTLAVRQVRDLHWPNNPNLRIVKYDRFKPRRISTKLEDSYFNFALGLRKYDVFHPTYYSSLVNKDWQSYGCPIVLTVYDMIHELYSDTLDPSGHRRAEKRRAIADAQTILCISQHTKRDLMEHCGVPESKIAVTYLAADLNADLSHGAEAVPDKPYFLYVGTRQFYKNFDSLLRSCSALAQAKREFVICVVGSPLTSEEQERIGELGLSDHIEFYGHSSDAQLAKLYRCSLAFVYPSFYEGFGIPPLEAMQCGTVVVASNASSVPEVVGGAALSFDPRDTDALTDILRAVADGNIDRDALIERGFERAKTFSWSKTANETMAVYRALTA